MAEASLPTRYLFIFYRCVDFRRNWTAIVLCNLSVGGFFSLNDQAPDSSPASRFLIGFLCVRVCGCARARVGACVCVCWKSWETLVNEANLRLYLPGVPADFGGKC